MGGREGWRFAVEGTRVQSAPPQKKVNTILAFIGLPRAEMAQR